MKNSKATRLLRGLLASAVLFAMQPVMFAHAEPVVTAVAGKPNLMLGAYDLAEHGYRQDEFFIGGSATSYRFARPVSGDGQWSVAPNASAPFNTRVVVVRPSDPAKFNGTVLIEWLNVTGGQDTPADWMLAHREILRRGYGYVAVSAQMVGVEGGNTPMGTAGRPLKKADPARYGTLSHPGDAFAFDIFSQVGSAVKARKDMLGLAQATRFIAMGESQSASYLTTYVNAVDPLARVYDGFLVHSRFGSSASLAGTGMGGAAEKMPDHVQFRSDLRVPVLSVLTETDVLGARLSGYHASRRPDYRHLRVWELAGTAHADNYLFKGAFIDSGKLSSEALADIYVPTSQAMAGSSSKPFNPGLAHHYILQGAIAGLDKWLRTGRPPAITSPLRLASGGRPGQAPSFALDGNGLALGGVRSPWVDVPTQRLSGKGDPASFIGMLAGSGEPMDKATLDRLYPGGKPQYLQRFTVALDAAIRSGHILADDRKEILDIAAINYQRKAPTSAAPPSEQSAGKVGYSTATSTIGTLIERAETKAVLDRFLPGFSGNPQLEMAKSRTLREIRQFMPDMFKEETLAQIDAELLKIPPQ